MATRRPLVFLDDNTLGELPQVDNLPSSFSGAIVLKTSGQTLTNNTATAIQFASIDYDTGGFFNPVNPTRLTAPVDGVYVVSASLTFFPNATGFRRFDMRKNGTSVPPGGSIAMVPSIGTGGGTVVVSSSAAIKLNAGDYIEIMGTQSSGADLNVLHTGATWFAIRKVLDSLPSVPMAFGDAIYPNALVGEAYSYTPTLTGDYIEPVTFSIQSGAIPTGIGWSFDTATGELFNPGPLTEETANFVVRATDSRAVPQTVDTAAQTVNVTDEPDTGIFGTQQTGGAGEWGSGVNRAWLTRWTMPENGNALSITHAIRDSGADTFSAKGVIYAADGPGGTAGTLVAVGTIFSVPPSSGPGLYTSDFAGESLIGLQDYYMGCITSNWPVTFDGGEAVPTNYTALYEPISYASPPTDLSGTSPGAQASNSVSAFVTYSK